MVRNKGFTLVELLFVIAIIGMILALLAPALTTVKQRALALECAVRLHNVAAGIEMYSSANNDVIPYIATGPEPRLHPKHWYQPQTGVPSLYYFLETTTDIDKHAACCPADTGCAGQSYYPTAPGVSCFDAWGQSMLYNSSCYYELGAPGYDSSHSGPLHGARPVARSSISRPGNYLMASDFWAHWHYGATSSSSGRPYYTNILFFDGHVAGDSYLSERTALAYLQWDGIRRWWVTNPAPFFGR
jgi:prepilin-type N-terminal cleavage/methylation domain-containing protein/prepilin-type processing-associated H-X9-DG protein